MIPAVEASGLVGRYGDLIAVAGVELRVQPGEVVGIVGPDGAGKTTLMQLLVGVLAMSGGSVSLFGRDLVKQRRATRGLLGYMSQAFSLYEDLTVAENIAFFAALRGVSRRERAEREERLLAFTRLGAFTGRRAGALSGGMKQKLGLICTLIHEPRVLFLDEPTNGVDPASRREFWEILGELRGRVAVVVATPYMDEAERCDRVALMAAGRFVAMDTPEGLRAGVSDPVWEIPLEDPFEGAERLRAEGVEADIQLLGDRIRVVTAAPPQRLAAAVGGGEPQRVRPSMEDAFVQLSRRSGAA